MSRYFLLNNEGLKSNLISIPDEEAEDYLERAVKVYDEVVELEEKTVHKE